ncbi:MAG TPA: endonuclease VIII [Gammaproteobacteria bacterium]|nr:endonuclease VIII [Gammaproteobacteria bacterium]
MPEGPEIRRAADCIEAAIQGKETTGVKLTRPHLKQWQQPLTGATVIALETHGKAMLTRFSNGLNLYTHNQLYGRWYCVDAGKRPETRRQLRVAIHTHDRSALLYSASEIAVLTESEVETHPFLSRLGPDVLSAQTTAGLLMQRFMDERFKRRQLATLLTDQSFVAGIGNYLRCEILFVCRLHPCMKPTQLSQQQLALLAQSLLDVPRQSYASGGITHHLASAKKMMQHGVTLEDARFWVFRREGKPCYRCGAPIMRQNSGGQPCYLCPLCQGKL